MSLFSCDTFNRWQLFSAACKGGEDCERFKKSLREWKEDLKTRPNYEKLISEEGVDENKNGLRDDVEIYIDDHLEALKGRHWMAKHPFKMYGAIIDYYSKVKPTLKSLAMFNVDYQRQANCSDAIYFAEALSGNSMLYIYAKIRYLLLSGHKAKVAFDNGFMSLRGQTKSLQVPELQILSDHFCNVEFKEMGHYKKRIFTWGGRKTKRQIEIDLMQYEKFHGKKYRSKYEEYLK